MSWPRDLPSPERDTATMSSLRFVIPMPANLANGRMHHMVKHRAKVAYWESLDTLCVVSSARQHQPTAYLVPPRPPAPMTPVRIDATLHLGGRMDDDNALARLKWCADWLKTRGYIREDKQPHCRFTIPEQVIKRDGNYRVELKVTQL